MDVIKIESIKTQLQAQIADVKKRISELRLDDPFTNAELTSNNAAIDNDVRVQEAHQRIEAEIQDLTDKMNDSQDALTRIAKGQYGVCKRCNQRIPEKRLELVPETKYCVGCESHLKG